MICDESFLADYRISHQLIFPALKNNLALEENFKTRVKLRYGHQILLWDDGRYLVDKLLSYISFDSTINFLNTFVVQCVSSSESLSSSLVCETGSAFSKRLSLDGAGACPRTRPTPDLCLLNIVASLANFCLEVLPIFFNFSLQKKPQIR